MTLLEHLLLVAESYERASDAFKFRRHASTAAPESPTMGWDVETVVRGFRIGPPGMVARGLCSPPARAAKARSAERSALAAARSPGWRPVSVVSAGSGSGSARVRAF